MTLVADILTGYGYLDLSELRKIQLISSITSSVGYSFQPQTGSFTVVMQRLTVDAGFRTTDSGMLSHWQPFHAHQL